MKPAFLITIDTEGDNLWARLEKMTTENAKFIPRFQQTCEKYGFKPTYLTNFEMAMNDYFQKIGKSYHRQGTAEIGTHIHAWDAPPVDKRYGNHIEHAYLFELPDDLLYEKMLFQTTLIEDRFELKPTSFRAGRWGMSETVMQYLDALGYLVDCSVTPYISWKHHPGLNSGNGGSDYTAYPTEAYYVDLNDMSKPGNSNILELPMTIMRNYNKQLFHYYQPYHKYFITKFFRKAFGQPITWLYPDLLNLKGMLRIVDKAIETGAAYIEFMLHSSELMPGGSPTFRTNEHIEKLYQHLNVLFQYILDRGFEGRTLSEYRALYAEKKAVEI